MIHFNLPLENDQVEKIEHINYRRNIGPKILVIKFLNSYINSIGLILYFNYLIVFSIQ